MGETTDGDTVGEVTTGVEAGVVGGLVGGVADGVVVGVTGGVLGGVAVGVLGGVAVGVPDGVSEGEGVWETGTVTVGGDSSACADCGPSVSTAAAATSSSGTILAESTITALPRSNEESPVPKGVLFCSMRAVSGRSAALPPYGGAASSRTWVARWRRPATRTDSSCGG